MIKPGRKALITTDAWFMAPDGREYRAVFGTVEAVLSDCETLGIKTNARSTNWYVKIGGMLIAGCQIHYAIECESAASGVVSDFSVESGEVKHFDRPSKVWVAPDV